MTLKARLAKLEEQTKRINANTDYKVVYCLDGENVEDACRRLGMPITEINNPNIFFVQFISSRDEI